MASNGSLSHLHEPLVLLVPGLNNSGPDHWQTVWERELPQCQRVDLGMWDNPHRNTWINQLNLAVHQADCPVVLVAHSLGCHAVAWWAKYEQPVFGHPVVGALLVAPPDVEGDGIDIRLQRFAPLADARLPFRSIVAASQNDPYARFGIAKRFARKWGSRLVDVGPIGHINADSGIGSWPYGQYLLGQLINEVAPRRAPLLSNGSVANLENHDQSKARLSR